MLFNITGIDGCGKTTQVKILQDYLISKRKEVFVSKAYGEKEKKCFDPIMPKLDQLSIMFLFQALHVEQYSKAIQAEKIGAIVIADRWDDSYLAYHSKFGILSQKQALRNDLNELAFKNKKPDLTFLLDVDVEIAQSRLNVRGKSFLDEKSLDFFKIMRNSFLQLAEKEKWIVLNGANQTNIVSSEIKKGISRYLI